MTTRTIVSASISGIAVSAIAWFLPWSWAVAFLSLLLALTAGIYIGIALVDGRRTAIVLESIQAVVLLGFLVLAATVHLAFLGAAWLAHPLWDLFHRHSAPARTPPFIITWCLVFDVIVGAATLVLVFGRWYVGT